MNLLHITAVTSVTTMLLISAFLYLIRKMPSRPGLAWWISASIIQSIVFILGTASFDKEVTIPGTIIFYCLAMLVYSSLSIGTLLFVNESVDIKKRLLLYGLSITAVIALTLSNSLFLACLLMSVYSAACLFQVAYKIYSIEDPKINYKITAFLMCLNAIHWLDYPFLSQIEWFVPIGFMLGMLLIASIFLNLALCALSQFKENTLKSERAAIHAATIDSLTGLYNRSHLNTLFNNYVKEAEQIERTFILLYFDLDGFKLINDAHGHKVGDLVLQETAERLRQWLGNKGDAIRIGGDEIVVLTGLRGKYDRKNAFTAAEQILSSIEKPIIDGNKSYSISASVGGCSYGRPLYSLEDMLNKADKLMYVAKQAGGRRVYFSHNKKPEAKLQNSSNSNEDNIEEKQNKKNVAL